MTLEKVDVLDSNEINTRYGERKTQANLKEQGEKYLPLSADKGLLLQGKHPNFFLTPSTFLFKVSQLYRKLSQKMNRKLTVYQWPTNICNNAQSHANKNAH